MPMFICDFCDGIENTVDGDFRHKGTLKYCGAPIADAGHENVDAYCSECTLPEVGGKGVWHGPGPKELATEELVLERGHWLEREMKSSVPRGFIHFGRFEYLRPQLLKRMKAAVAEREAANAAMWAARRANPVQVKKRGKKRRDP